MFDVLEDVWEHLQDRDRAEGGNPLLGLAADVCATLGDHTPKGECINALANVYRTYYEHRSTTLRDMGVCYVPPRDAPDSVRDLFANRNGFMWQRDLERAMMDATAWAARDDTIDCFPE